MGLVSSKPEEKECPPCPEKIRGEPEREPEPERGSETVTRDYSTQATGGRKLRNKSKSKGKGNNRTR